MTREEKQLLLKDLCARLPYGFTIYRLSDNANLKINDINEFAHFLEYSDGEEFKPYLRSMSSMTAKEKTLMATICLKYVSGNVEGAVSELSDFYNSRYFDYRGLIPMGLALEAPDDMYKTK